MGKKRKKYSEDFRREAINLLISSGKSTSQVARELGIEVYNLSRWKQQFLGKDNPQEDKLEDPADKIRRLEQESKEDKKEIADLKQKVEILKKAMNIVSKP